MKIMPSLKTILIIAAVGTAAYYLYYKRKQPRELETSLEDDNELDFPANRPTARGTQAYFYPEDEIPEAIRQSNARVPYVPTRGCPPGYVAMELRGPDTAGVIGNPASRRVVCQQVATQQYQEGTAGIPTTLGKFGPAYQIYAGMPLDTGNDPRLLEWYTRNQVLSNYYFGAPGGSYPGSGYSQFAGGLGPLPQIHENPYQIG